MSYIKEEEINNIRDNADIATIISDYIPLTKSGKDYVGVCPFHDDHSPSMHVSPERKIYKCFVCGSGGNVFSFVKNYENVSYLEAIKIVADKIGINFTYTSNTSFDKNKEYYDIMNLSLNYYNNALETSKGIKAKEYLSKRGIDERIINEFKLGLSLDNNSLKKFLEDKKIDTLKAENIGLLNKDGINLYDTFVNRIMIPIFDTNNHLVGYTGRIYEDGDQNSKYKNSKETIIYKKSNILFNFNNAKDYAKKEKEIVIVEGNMDAISLSVGGIKNVIALMGVAISDFQIEILKRLNVKIILMLDNDDAGCIGTLNVGNEISKKGLPLYVVRLSGAKDPDEYIRSFGKEKLIDTIKHPISFLDFKLLQIKKDKDLTKIGDLTSYVKEVLENIDDAPELERNIIIDKICNEYHLDKSIFLDNIKPIEKKVIKEEVIVKNKSTRYEKSVYKLIYALLLNKKYYNIYMDKLGYLLNKVERDTVSMIGSFIKKYNDINIASFIDYVENYPEISTFIDKIMQNNDFGDLTDEDFYGILSVTQSCINKEEINKLKLQIKEETDINKKMILLDKIAKLKKDGE